MVPRSINAVVTICIQVAWLRWKNARSHEQQPTAARNGIRPLLGFLVHLIKFNNVDIRPTKKAAPTSVPVLIVYGSQLYTYHPCLVRQGEQHCEAPEQQLLLLLLL